MRLAGRLVDPPLALRPPPEVLDHVGAVGVRGLDARVGKGSLEHSSGRADERPALPVLLVAGLLSEQHQPGPLRPLAHDGLGRVAVELAATALLHRVA